jgi:hypothetical protein
VAFKDSRLLELAANAQGGDPGLVHLGQVGIAIKQDAALVGPGLAGDHIHHGRLARPVGADDGAHFARHDDQ